MNFKLKKEREAGFQRTPSQIKAELRRQCTQDASLQSTWKELFRLYRARRRQGVVHGADSSASSVGGSSSPLGVWPAALQSEECHAAVPVHPEVAVDHVAADLKTMATLGKLEQTVAADCFAPQGDARSPWTTPRRSAAGLGLPLWSSECVPDDGPTLEAVRGPPAPAQPLRRRQEGEARVHQRLHRLGDRRRGGWHQVPHLCCLGPCCLLAEGADMRAVRSL